MYSIYADGICIHDDIFVDESMKALNPKLTLADNAAGSLSLTLTPQNAGYNTVQRLLTAISVRKNGAEIWAGRVLSETMDFWNNRTLYCEGELAFLNDSVQPPAAYVNATIREYLQSLIRVHNAKVEEEYRFTLGAVTVHDGSLPTFYTNYEKTMEALNGLIETYGGHMRVRKENGVRYLDYLAQCPNTCTQTIRFGTNLIDFTRQWDLSEFVTVLVPLGKRQDESAIEGLDAYLTVASVNGGSIYVVSENDALHVYGRIEKTVSWSEVEDPEVLLEKARTYLSELQFDNMELELSALDLHYLDVDYEAVKLLDEIRVISRPHGLNRLFPVTKLEIPLDSPEKTQFKLGDTVKTSLTAVNNQTNAAILERIDNLPKAQSVLKEAKENAAAIMDLATNGFITITKNQNGSEALIISSEQDYTRADKYWKWNLNGLAYYSRDQDSGQPDLPIAITMDGSIVADYITTGTMSADRIRTGILESAGENRTYEVIRDSSGYPVKDHSGNDIESRSNRFGNVVFNLNEGTLMMKRGSIQLGEYSDGHYQFEVDDTGRLYAGESAIFAGNLNAAGGTFGGALVAATGNFKGVVEASDFISSITGQSMMKNGKFDSRYLDLGKIKLDGETGNISMEGDLNLSRLSSIKWGPFAPVKYQFSVNGSSGWHDAMTSTDKFRRDSLDGGTTWGSPYQFRGTDGQDGQDGSDADVTYANVNRVLNDLFLKNTQGNKVEITSTTIYAPEIQGGNIYGVDYYGNTFNIFPINGDNGSLRLYGSDVTKAVFEINYNTMGNISFDTEIRGDASLNVSLSTFFLDTLRLTKGINYGTDAEMRSLTPHTGLLFFVMS